MAGQSIGDVISPYIKQKPLPPNPNAVLTLQNRRTEAKNRARNDGVSANNNALNNVQNGNKRPPFRRPTTTRSIPTLSNNVIQEEELPPRRGKPLPSDIKILLAVLGTVGAVMLILYLLKKFAYDKVHKNSTGRIMHAYAHFRRFKKKRNADHNEEEVHQESKINTIAASVSSADNATQSRDSGHMTLNEKEGLENGLTLELKSGTDLRGNSNKASSIMENMDYGEADAQKGTERRKKSPSRRPRDRSQSQRPDSDGTSASDCSSEKKYHHRRRRRRKKREHKETAHRKTQSRRPALHRHKKNSGTHSKDERAPFGRDRRERNRNAEEVEKSRDATSCSERKRSLCTDSSDSPRRSNWRDRTYS